MNEKLAVGILGAVQVAITIALGYSAVTIPEPWKMLLVVVSGVLAWSLNQLPAVAPGRHDPDL